MADKLVVTRHIAMLKYLINRGLVEPNVTHKAFVTAEDVVGKHVFGVLPNWLACKAEKFTEVQLRLPQDARGKELTLKDIEYYAVEPKTYIIREIENE